MARGNDAADAIRREIKRLEQLAQVAAILDEFGSLENATDEAKQACEKAQKERDAAQVELKQVKDNLESDTKLHNDRLVEQGAELATVWREAKAEATEIKTKARSAAMKATEAARRASQKIQDESNQYLLGASEKRGRLDKEVSELEKMKADLEAQTAEWAEKLAQAKERINAMMAQ